MEEQVPEDLTVYRVSEAEKRIADLEKHASASFWA